MTFGQVLCGKPPQDQSRPYRIAAIDVETDGLDGRPLLWSLRHEDMPETLTFRNGVDLVHSLMAMPSALMKRTRIYAHNAEYDWRYLIDAFKSARLETIVLNAHERAEGTLFKIGLSRRDAKRLTFLDSMALFDNSLDEFTRLFAPNLLKLDIGLRSGTKFNPDNANHVAYAKRDVEGLVAALSSFDELLYKTFRVHSCGTIAGTSFQSFLRTIPETKRLPRIGKIADAFVREAYYGGMVVIRAPARRIMRGVSVIDINSAYPAAM